MDGGRRNCRSQTVGSTRRLRLDEGDRVCCVVLRRHCVTRHQHHHLASAWRSVPVTLQ